MCRSALLLLAVLTFFPGPSFADERADPQAGEKPAKQTLIRVAKETTYLVEPLDAEGYVDYVEAVNQRFSKGVTPENNYEVVVRRVMGPVDISIAGTRAEYDRRLGIPEIPVEGDYFESFHASMKASGLDANGRQRVDDEFSRAMEAPWTDADLPRAAKWLKSADAHLDALVEGSRRRRNYTPYLSGDWDEDWVGPRMIAVLLPSAQHQREIARSLVIRAMYRLGNDDVEGAWSDLQAMHRIARLVGSGATLIEGLVGIAIDAIALQAEQHVLDSPQLTDALAEQCLADLVALPPTTATAEQIDFGERLMGLDATQAIARRGGVSLFESLKLINDLSDATATPFGNAYVTLQPAAGAARRPVENTPDWNVTLRVMNEWYDRIAAAARTEGVRERHEKMEAFAADLKSLRKDFKDPATFFVQRLLGKSTREATGKAIGDVLVVLLLPAVSAATTAEERVTARLQVQQLGFAAEVYRRDTGRLPGKLEDLKPKYVTSLPVDAMTGEPLQVERTDDALVIYSVGQNREDDGGIGYDDRPAEDRESDDLAVRLRAR